MKEKLEAIAKKAEESLANAQTPADLEEIRVSILGKKGELTAILKQMGSLSPEERPIMGQLCNSVRASIEEQISNRSAVILEEQTKNVLKQRQ